MIDSSKPPSPKRRGKNFHELLDRKKNVVPVASKETFVGRRRQTKQALRVFTENSAAGVLLTGMGGSGKSSLAARVVHRMEPQYKAAIIYKDYSEAAILGELKQFVPSDSRNGDFQRYLTDIQQNPDLFADNLVDILEQHLSENPIILVVDDLEQHALDELKTASATDGKVGVKRAYQNALRGVIEAFARADTPSRLILTSRHSFRVPDWRGQDVAEELLEIEVPDMNPVEQEKHWLALLQSGAMTGARDEAQDRAFLEQIWAICQGNPGLQDVLYQPLLKGEYAVLQTALSQLQAYHAGQLAALANASREVDKYLQRIALEAYHAALTDTERQCLRVLSLFDFAVPEQLIIQAGAQLGIEDARTALQRLDNFGLLTHWQGEGLEGHISCYGLARKIVAPLSKEDRHYIASVCVPLLWHIWFADFLVKSLGDSTELKEAIADYPLLPPEKSQELMQLELQVLQQIYPLQTEKHHALPLQQNEFQRISQLHEFCIMNSRYDWQALGVDPEHFIDLLELSLSLAYFEKLAMSRAMLMQLTDDQVKELNRILEEERSKFKAIQADNVFAFIHIVLHTFSGTHLLTRAYQLYVANADQKQLQTLSGIQLSNEEDRLVAAIKLSGNTGKADAYGNYAYFLANQKQDYAQAEVMYQRAVEA
ncbi:AAA ATPase domain-containing protein, partial [Thiothrix eikelboomii]